jgi:hypothetical protein
MMGTHGGKQDKAHRGQCHRVRCSPFGCLYIKKLADVDHGVLEQLIAGAVAARRASAATR